MGAELAVAEMVVVAMAAASMAAAARAVVALTAVEVAEAARAVSVEPMADVGSWVARAGRAVSEAALVALAMKEEAAAAAAAVVSVALRC